MKALFTSILILALPIISLAQVEWNPDSQTARYEKVIEVQGVDQESIYERAKIWMAMSLKSGDNQMLKDELNKESLIGSGNIHLQDKNIVVARYINRFLNFKVSLFFKDGKVKCIIENIILSETYRHHNSQSQIVDEQVIMDLNIAYKKKARKNKSKKNKKQIEVDDALKLLIEGLEKSLRKNEPAKDEDW